MTSKYQKLYETFATPVQEAMEAARPKREEFKTAEAWDEARKTFNDIMMRIVVLKDLVEDQLYKVEA